MSVWENDGALVVYDAATLEEVKRLPMRKPVGKYNVYNKITRVRRARATDAVGRRPARAATYR